MPLDTFICGNCQLTFSDLSHFVFHKQQNCSTSSNSLPIDPAGEVIQLHFSKPGVINGMTSELLAGDDNVATLTFLNDVDLDSNVGRSELEQREDATTSHLIILNNRVDTGSPSLGLLESARHVQDMSSNSSLIHADELQAVGKLTQACLMGVEGVGHVGKEEEGPDGEVPAKKKRLGRPKNGEGKVKVMEAVPPAAPRPTVADMNADGKLMCPMCKRTFAKERHFLTHKCLASSSYVDITKKEIKIDSGDEEEAMVCDEGAGDDEGEEFLVTIAEDYEEADLEMTQTLGMSAQDDGRKKRRGRQRRNPIDQFNQNSPVDNSGARQLKAAAESMENVPIFRNDEDKTEFETCIDVDLSQKVDHMFRIHIIEQELNEMSGQTYNTPTMSSLSIYSCTVCDKVFKSLSHIRLHCITHTDLKPFKCNKCAYATNSKGNLYTHMRKHTGQFYRCDQCDFKTVNKSHLVEHHMTHDNRRSQCLICQKDYSTLKSLINHIRKYHTDKKGKEYLQTFLQGRGLKGTTVIHQCHVCNRKFKKRIDRDRHLFIHDITDLPHVQQCELCDYWASRQVYLEKHYLKHRVIYCCVLCNLKFLSTIRLTEHLALVHVPQDEGGTVSVTDSWLEECINRSLYLPEPVSCTDLPEELQERAPTQNNEEAVCNAGLEQAEPVVDLPTQDIPTSGIDPHREDKEDISVMSAYKQLSLPCPLTVGSADLGETSKDWVSDSQGQIGSEAGTTHKDQDLQAESSWHGLKTEHGEQNQEKDGSIQQELQPESCGLAQVSHPLLVLHNPGSDSDEGEDGDRQDLCSSPPLAETPEEQTLVLGDPSVKREHESCGRGQPQSDGRTEPAVHEKSTLGTEGVGAGGGPSQDQKIEVLIKRLGYRKMNMDIFKKMRDTFGTEECEYCGRLFYSRADYEPHLRTHTGDKPFVCANCSFRGTTREQVKKHTEREHEPVTFQCKECDFLAASRSRLWNHQLKHLGISGLTCPRCPSKFDGMKQLRAHILNDHQDIDKESLEKLTGYRQKPLGKMGRRSFKCPHCPRVFIRANSELQKHIWIHEGIRPFACPLCSYTCRSKNNLQAHMLRHSSEKPFCCSQCGKEYKSKTALRWHVRSHQTGKIFKCDKCSYEASQSSHLKRHMETHEVLKRFTCQLCDFSANTLGYIKIHYAKHHKGKAFIHGEVVNTSTATSEKKVYKCLSCGYLFGNLSDLKRHLKIRHHIQMQDIAGIEQMQISEVEVVHYDDSLPSITTSDTASIESQQSVTQAASNDVQVPGRSVSAVSLIHQLIGMSQGEGQVRVVSEDGQPLDITPETIIVHQDGQLLLTTDSSGMVQGNQYIIQYFNQGDVPAENNQNSSLEISSDAHQLIPSEGQGQYILTSDGQLQLISSDNCPEMLTDQSQISDSHSEILAGNDCTENVLQERVSSHLIEMEADGQVMSAESGNTPFDKSDLNNQLSMSNLTDFTKNIPTEHVNNEQKPEIPESEIEET